MMRIRLQKLNSNGYSLIRMSYVEQKPQLVMLYGTQCFVQAMLLTGISVIQLVNQRFMEKVVCVTSFERLKGPKYMH